MAKALRDLIERSKNNVVDNSISPDGEKMIPFTYDGKNYSIAIKDDILVFDGAMVLISTISREDLALADSDFLRKINDIVTANTNQRIVLFVNKSKGVEKMTFSSLFDATYIFRKLSRVADRPSEGIESIVIEKGSKVLRSYTNSKARFMKSIGKEDVEALEDRESRNEDKTELLAALARVEDGMDDIINDNISNEGVQYDSAKVARYIDLLTSLQEKYGTNPDE